MTTTRVAVIPGTGGVPYPTRSMDSSIEEALKAGLDEREVFPFG